MIKHAIKLENELQEIKRVMGKTAHRINRSNIPKNTPYKKMKSGKDIIEQYKGLSIEEIESLYVDEEIEDK